MFICGRHRSAAEGGAEMSAVQDYLMTQNLRLRHLPCLLRRKRASSNANDLSRPARQLKVWVAKVFRRSSARWARWNRQGQPDLGDGWGLITRRGHASQPVMPMAMTMLRLVFVLVVWISPETARPTCDDKAPPQPRRTSAPPSEVCRWRTFLPPRPS
jgi:hypothetical protein